MTGVGGEHVSVRARGPRLNARGAHAPAGLVSRGKTTPTSSITQLDVNPKFRRRRLFPAALFQSHGTHKRNKLFAKPFIPQSNLRDGISRFYVSQLCQRRLLFHFLIHIIILERHRRRDFHNVENMWKPKYTDNMSSQYSCVQPEDTGVKFCSDELVILHKRLP